MGRQLSLKLVRKNFLNAICVSAKIHGTVREDCILNYDNITGTGWSTFPPALAAKVVGLAFLNCLAAHEEFLEESFVRYVAGAMSESGYSPVLRVGAASSLKHARQLVLGTPSESEAWRRGRWSDYRWVMEKAHIFFERGEPYTSLPKGYTENFMNAQLIRNRIAHSSSKARQAFQRVANEFLGKAPHTPLRRGFSPGILLVSQEFWFDSEPGESFWGDLFEAYVDVFLYLADVITPSLEANPSDA